MGVAPGVATTTTARVVGRAPAPAPGPPGVVDEHAAASAVSAPPRAIGLARAPQGGSGPGGERSRSWRRRASSEAWPVVGRLRAGGKRQPQDPGLDALRALGDDLTMTRSSNVD